MIFNINLIPVFDMFPCISTQTQQPHVNRWRTIFHNLNVWLIISDDRSESYFCMLELWKLIIGVLELASFDIMFVHSQLVSFEHLAWLITILHHFPSPCSAALTANYIPIWHRSKASHFVFLCFDCRHRLCKMFWKHRLYALAHCSFEW